MTLGEKLSKLRKEHNYTQEQLAGIFEVSRQSISKWESDAAYPETDKLVRIAELYDCSLDYLLKEAMETDVAREQAEKDDAGAVQTIYKKLPREKRSEKIVLGMPLWHIGRNAKGVFAVGLNAAGIVAVGLKAKGVISVGVLSIGLISIGTLSVGLLSLGLIALGILAAGCFAAGLFAAGAICLGVIATGAIAAGDFAIGALANGRYFALGDHAKAAIAIGATKAAGSLYEKVGRLGELSAQELSMIRRLLDENVPSYLAWAKELIKFFL